MSKSPILIVEDDPDDTEIMQDVLLSIKNTRPVHFFRNADELIAFLLITPLPPYLIISDINLPGMNGLELKKRLKEDQQLNHKGVPFIFLSTNSSPQQVRQAYDLLAQGCFLKPTDFASMCNQLKSILDYWNQNEHPNEVL